MSPPTWLLLVALLLPAPASAAISRAEVERAVTDVREALARDRGRLWGVRLDGPILFVDPATREVVATAPDSAGALKPEGAFHHGVLPPEITVANTAVRWAGRSWTMVLWPLPADPLHRRALLIHELWHRVQERIGLPATGPANAHLDTPEGRLWIQLEWRALARALETSGRERREAIADALAFRALRRQIFAGSAAEENALERHEGLAEYTGVRLAHPTRDGAHGYAQAAIANAKQRASFVRSFAYVSGPAYGLLLDRARPKWRRDLNPGADLGDLLRAALRLPAAAGGEEAARRRAGRYDGDALEASERARERERQERLAVLRQRFVSGPVLRLPLQAARFSFDPGRVQPLDSAGTVYAGLQISETWGVLEAPDGGLIAREWNAAFVPLPFTASGDTLRGPGWTLRLSPGWHPRPAEPAGCLQLSAKE